MAEQNRIPCPREGCDTMCLSPNGLKKHISRSHGTWSDEEIATALQKAGFGSVADAEQSEMFDEGSASQDSEESASTDRPQSGRPRQSRKSKKTDPSVRLSNALAGFKENLSEVLPGIYQNLIEEKAGVKGTITDKMKASLTELWSAYFDLLGFDLSASPISFKVSGKWVTLLFPILMLPITFLVLTGKTFMLPKKEPVQQKRPEPVATIPIYEPEPPSASVET